ncbi:MAG: Lin0512 family protein [Chloroflexi bacterium]|nr:Lin0512 family protein [Chloroflexota bacterium]
MTLRRCLLELGTGVDLHGLDSTKAARRAVADALRHSSVAFAGVFGYDPRLMYVEVNVAVPRHENVRPGEVLLELPYGIKTINVMEGGLELSDGDGGDSTIMANAAIIVSLDVPD